MPTIVSNPSSPSAFSTTVPIAVGSIVQFLGIAAPDGYLPLKGDTYLDADWPALVQFATNNNLIVPVASWTTGTGKFARVDTTHFKVPDLRKLYAKGWDGTTANIGLYGADTTKYVTGTETIYYTYETEAPPSGASSRVNLLFNATTPAETEPKHFNVMYIIRAE